MKIKTILTCVATCLFMTAHGQGDALKVKEFKLDNGLTVWINEDHSQPKVFGAVVVKAGANDSPNTGMAHYFEHILFKGTDKIGTTDYAKEKVLLDSISAEYDRLAATSDDAERKTIQTNINRLSSKATEYAIPNEFDVLIARYGGTRLNAATSYTYTYFYNTFTPQYINQWAELNSERMITPVFRLFQSELETVYEEKNMYSDNMITGALEHIMGQFFKGSPYEYPIIGSTENLKNPRLSEMKEFYDKYYVAGNMGLILCGDINADEIKPVLERTFGRLRPGTAPSREPLSLVSLANKPEIKVNLEIPIIKISGRLYRAPASGSADEPVFNLAMTLFSNGNEAGMLDSLTNSGSMLMATGQYAAFSDTGLAAFVTVPNILFGSKKKAEALCVEQIEKVKRGEFSDETLKTLKMEMERDFKRSLESIGNRAETMIAVFANGQSWDDYLKVHETAMRATKADVVRVANKYLGDEYMKVVKKFGSYPKDKVSQPGYEAMKSPNLDTESDYAKSLDTLAVSTAKQRFIDFNNDAKETVIGDKMKLYTVKNPVNDVFDLSIVYRKGTLSDPRLSAVSDYISTLGTDSLSKQELGKTLQKLGTIIETNAEDKSFTINISGFDNNFKASLRLLKSFMNDLKADKKKYDEMLQSCKIEEKAFMKDNTSVASAVTEKVFFGDKSRFLTRVTQKELARMKGEDLVRIFRELQDNECSIIYSGTLDDEQVAQELKNVLNTTSAKVARDNTYRPLKPYDESVVYVYDFPKARQTVLVTYTPLGAAPTRKERTIMSLAGKYLGGGMSSVLFQELREMRSLAYYTGGNVTGPSLIEHPNDLMAFGTRTGTQADKVMGALEVLDSLLNDTPIRSKNVESTRQEMINSISADYPTFRTIGETIANYKLIGYDKDPDEEIARILPELTEEDIKNFYDSRLKGATQVTIIVGDKKKLDMGKLSKYGKVVEMKLEDIYKK